MTPFCLRQCGRKPTVLDRLNPMDLHPLTLTHRGPPHARSAALVARRAAIYQIQSASFRTRRKEVVTWFGGVGLASYEAYSTTTTCTHADPRASTPTRLAAASERSMMRRLPPPRGPRSLMRTT